MVEKAATIRVVQTEARQNACFLTIMMLREKKGWHRKSFLYFQNMCEEFN